MCFGAVLGAIQAITCVRPYVTAAVLVQVNITWVSAFPSNRKSNVKTDSKPMWKRLWNGLGTRKDPKPLLSLKRSNSNVVVLMEYLWSVTTPITRFLDRVELGVARQATVSCTITYPFRSFLVTTNHKTPQNWCKRTKERYKRESV